MRCVLLAFLLAAVALSAIPATNAYSTTEAVYTSPTGQMTYYLGQTAADVCTSLDPGSHLPMGTSASIQARILETMTNNGVSTAIPLGGGSMQATCTSQLCSWRWWRGFYFYIWPIFYRGVYYTGPQSSAAASPTDKTQAVENSYSNWDTQYPVSWSNLSYWGKRVVVMQPTTGKWRNAEVASKYTTFVCEHYVYQNSDGVNGITPTFPNGSPITLVSSSGHVYSFCGKAVHKDSQGRWILPKCGDKFPWWAGLVIAVGCYIILVALIIIIWCCCCMARRNKEEKHRREVIGTEADNVSRIPTQTELGLSRNTSFRNHSFERETGDTYSESGSYESGSSSTWKSSHSSSGSSASSSRSSSRHNASRE